MASYPHYNYEMNLKGKDFLSTADFTLDELTALIDLATKIKAGDYNERPLAGRSVALVFFNPSLRTRASMEIGIYELGGNAVTLDVGKGTWSLEYREAVRMDGDKTEHIKEAARVLELCAGEDSAPLAAYQPPRTLEEETTWDDAVTGTEPLGFVLRGLAARVSARLCARGEAAEALDVTLQHDSVIARFRGVPPQTVLHFKLSQPLHREAELRRIVRGRLAQRERGFVGGNRQHVGVNSFACC